MSSEKSFEKVFINPERLKIDSFLLARQIYKYIIEKKPVGTIFIVGLWRGGAPIGLYIQSYLEYMGVETDHICIRTSSYYAPNQRSKVVMVHGQSYVAEHAKPGDVIIYIDDVFDTGNSIKAVFEDFDKSVKSEYWRPRILFRLLLAIMLLQFADVRFWAKLFFGQKVTIKSFTTLVGVLYCKPEKNKNNLKPDFCNKDYGPEVWIVFPHELVDMYVSQEGDKIEEILGTTVYHICHSGKNFGG